MLPITTASPPAQFDVVNHPVKDTLVIVSNLLSILVQKNDKNYNPARDPITLFHSRAVPRISIEAYLTRILQYIPFTNEVLLNVLVYLDRIGGLEGMKLQQCGTVGSSSSTTITEAIVPQAIFVSTPASTVSSPKDPEIFLSASSSSINSDNGLPMVQKRGREEAEAIVDVQCKRTRAESYASSTVTDFIPTPVSTPAPAPAQAPSTAATNGFRINSFNVHRLLITCLMVAAKFTSDLFYSNARYAKVGGLSLPELNQLELEFLFTTKFELNVKVEELQRVGNALFQFRGRHMARAVLLQHQLQQQTQQMQYQQQPQMQMQEIQMKQNSIPSPSSPSTYSSAAAFASNAGHIQTIPRPLQQQQRTQLLSPPEEKLAWAETEVQETLAPRIDNHPRQY
ncbi:hypothetical protein BGZ58_004752 [Dissophora ornata]|nr:hypothetical protein BGZ58_004752 [Dissophora ornata]